LQLSRKAFAAIILLVIAATAAAVYAVIVYTRNIQTTVTIITYDELSVRDPITNEEIYSWEIGEVYRNTLHNLSCLIEYIGDSPEGRYIAWECPDLPSGMTLTAQFDDGTGWHNWPEGMLIGPLTSQVVLANFTLNTGTVSDGDYAFTLMIEARDGTG